MLTLSSLQNEGNTIPSLVLDVCNHGAECRAPGILRNSVVLLVCGLASIQRLPILADDDVLRFDGIHGTQDTNLRWISLACCLWT